ncbi:hypothetical protein KIS4809_3750 [Bacillus sp. ZZV12-4809]|nr:hypothetical protein KIS4809_3750 [Bacillus sp. ZZV12-4809]
MQHTVVLLGLGCFREVCCFYITEYKLLSRFSLWALYSCLREACIPPPGFTACLSLQSTGRTQKQTTLLKKQPFLLTIFKSYLKNPSTFLILSLMAIKIMMKGCGRIGHYFASYRRLKQYSIFPSSGSF